MKTNDAAEPAETARLVEAGLRSCRAPNRLKAPRPESEPTRARYISHGLLYAAAIILLGAFLAPLWHYNFTAPLYPEYPQGLPMTIYINHLGGRLNLINGLNHYIGMAKIDQNEFRVLNVMPWLVAFLCASGVIVAVWSRDRLWPLVAWLGAFAAIGLALLGDFYWWLYSYGHNLNPHAAIRIAPFTPHMLSSYTILGTFHVMTWPGFGGIAMMASFGLGFLALLVQWLAMRGSAGPSIKDAKAVVRSRRASLIATTS